MEISKAQFRKYLDRFSFSKNGDRYEKEYGHLLAKHFQNCEVFWRCFVVPFTRRIEGFPSEIGESIKNRQEVDPDIQDIGALNYSMFLNLVFAHLDFEKKDISSFESIYTHLATTCDLAEMIIERMYFLFLKCRSEESKYLQQLTREEFLDIAGKWYDEKYHDYFKFYLQRGKNPPLVLNSRDDILQEYLGKESVDRKVFARTAGLIRPFRNAIVHDMRVARIIRSGSIFLVPKPKLIDKYRKWRDVFAILNNAEKIKSDFVEQYQQAHDDIVALEYSLNELWKKITNDFEEEFYSTERTKLREMYGIEFTPDTLTEDANERKKPTITVIPPPSGVYTDTGGSAVFQLPTDKNDL